MLLFASITFAQTVPQKIKAMHKAGETYSTAFVETEVMPKLKKQTVRKGNLTYKAPSELKMDYTDPKGDYMEITATTISINKDGKLQKHNIKENAGRMSTLQKTLLLAFAGDVDGIAQLNEAQVSCEDKNGQYTCTITSQKKTGLSSLILIYDKKTGKLISLTLNQSNGNYTTYSVK